MADFLGKSGRRKPVSRAAGRFTFSAFAFRGNSRAYTCEPTAQTRVDWNTGRDLECACIDCMASPASYRPSGAHNSVRCPNQTIHTDTRRTRDTVQANPRGSTGTAVHDLEVHAPTTERPSAGRSGTARHTMNRHRTHTEIPFQHGKKATPAKRRTRTGPIEPPLQLSRSTCDKSVRHPTTTVRSTSTRSKGLLQQRPSEAALAIAHPAPRYAQTHVHISQRAQSHLCELRSSPHDMTSIRCPVVQE